ncbi:DNA polymerase [Dissulfuribacter thermophilus]|uniref:DNA polymerase n=1 Tax=Dissulfuribacter thermophilus TaxID=1156395 RepID=A0A1B9F8B3_9BACT|nr:OB-fold nucleic acid binding domain-containing protein [Dissulfuribacter thermophilus]OCC16011.1 DNA polymerase [Dissulfuribacter thermophilus]
MNPIETNLDFHIFDLWVNGHPLEYLRPQLNALGFLSKKDLETIPNNSMVKVAGALVMVHTPPTRSGKRVMFITIEDETGLIDLVAFEDIQKKWAREIFTSEILAVEGILKKEGKGKRAMSIVVKRIFPQIP